RSGFDADNTILTEQLIGRRFFIDATLRADRRKAVSGFLHDTSQEVVLHQMLREYCHIVRARVAVRRIGSIRYGEATVLESDTRRVAVHFVDKGLSRDPGI